jgi:hypothetical protein
VETHFTTKLGCGIVTPSTATASDLATIISLKLGWEFRFLVPISGTPIRSGIPIPFSIPKIQVGIFFSNSAVEKSRNRNSNPKIRNSEKKKKHRNSIHLILHMISITIGQLVGITMSNHMEVGYGACVGGPKTLKKLHS